MLDWILANVPLVAAILFILHGLRLLIEDWWADRKRQNWELSHMQSWLEEQRARQREEENWELRTKDFDRGG
jgi:hypothetical protein